MYCGLSIASSVFLIFNTQLYQYFSAFFLFALFSDKPKVFLPKYSQTAITHAAHFRRVVKYTTVDHALKKTAARDWIFIKSGDPDPASSISATPFPEYLGRYTLLSTGWSIPSDMWFALLYVKEPRTDTAMPGLTHGALNGGS